MEFKKGPQGLSVSFTMPAGKNEGPVAFTGVDYSPDPAELRPAVSRRCGRYRVRRQSAVSELDHRDDRRHPRFLPQGARRCGLVAVVRSGRCGAMAERETGRQGRERRTSPITSAKTNGRFCFRSTRRRTARPTLKSRSRRLRSRRRLRPGPRSSVCRGQSCVKTSGGTGGSDHARDARPCACRSRHGAGVLSPRTAARNWKEEAQGAVVKPEAVTLNFTAGRPGRAQARPQI